MAALTPAEIITASFYAWEVRGRGWTLADHPVSLEPPHRPFFILPQLEAWIAGPGDDGRRHTFLSGAAERVRAFFSKGEGPPKAIEPFEEEPPYPAPERGELVAFNVRVPPDFAADHEVAAQLLLALSGSAHQVSFEVVGHAGAVSIQFACFEEDAAHVREALRGFVPDAVLAEHEDVLAKHWTESERRVVVDLGLANEFFLPIREVRSFRVDSLIPLVNALSQTTEDELACVQVLFERVRNPWAKTITDALVDRRGATTFADAPEFVSLAREKTRSPILAAIVRLGVSGQDDERVAWLAKAIAGVFPHFGRADSNEFIPLANDEYDDALHEEAFLTRESWRTGMLVSVDELLALVHLPDASVTHSGLARLDRHTKPLPAVAKGHALVLGDNVHHGISTPATIPAAARLAHTHIVGSSGVGKSTLLLNLIVQDVERGEGVAVIDPHGDLIEAILDRVPDRRVDDVIVFDPSDADWPVGFNVLEAKTEAERSLLASDMVAVFRRLSTSWGDAMNTVLANAVLAIVESKSGGTLVDLRRFLVEDAVRRRYLAEIDDEHVRYFWEKEYKLIGARSIGPILTRLDAFLRSRAVRHIVGQEKGRLNLDLAAREQKIVLAKLSQGLVGEENARLLGTLLVSKIHQVALARQSISPENRRPFYLYVDEFQHFVTPSMASLLSEARKYGVGLTLAHQSLAQLRSAPEIEGALGNANTRIVFRCANDEARRLAENFASYDAEDLLRLNVGEAIARIGPADNDFNLRVRAVSTAEPVPAQSEAVVAASRLRFGTPIAEVLETLRLPVEKQEPRVRPEQKWQELERKPAVDKLSETESVAAPVAPLREAPISPRQTASTPLPRPPLPTLGRGGREHKYLQHLVKRLAEERGFHATIEDPAGEMRSVDVVLRRNQITIGCEIAVTTDIGHEIANLRKCVEQNFSRIFVVSSDKRRREGMKKRIVELGGISTTTPIDVLSPEEIVEALDQLGSEIGSTETVVRGYKVKVKRQTLTSEDLAGKRATIADVIARSMRRTRDL